MSGGTANYLFQFSRHDAIGRQVQKTRDINIRYAFANTLSSLLLHSLQRPPAHRQAHGNKVNAMMLEKLNNTDYLDFLESQVGDSKRLGDLHDFPALPPVGVPEFTPNPIKRPNRKDRPEEKSLDGLCLPDHSNSDIWSYLPDCILKNWRRSHDIPGVRILAPFDKSFATYMQAALFSSGHCAYVAITAVAGSKYYEN